MTRTSTCAEYLLYASTTTGYLNLTGCPYDTQTPVPSLPIHVGTVVHIAGPEAAHARLSLQAGVSSLRLTGDIIVGVKPGRSTIMVGGVDCDFAIPDPTQSCPLLEVVVT
ncbi:hypothetical protein acdb102_25000 [Acidothermaceae bacterium B102]|nr:hypothetical protein acdb102_25000 [Acidothermaceae bacterium B102]